MYVLPFQCDTQELAGIQNCLAVRVPQTAFRNKSAKENVLSNLQAIFPKREVVLLYQGARGKIYTFCDDIDVENYLAASLHMKDIKMLNWKVYTPAKKP